MWQSLAYARYPYFDAQNKARVRGDKLTRDYDLSTVFETHPQRIALLSLTPELAAEIPVLNGFVYSPFEFEVLTYTSGKLSMLEMAEAFSPSIRRTSKVLMAFRLHLLETVKKLEAAGCACCRLMKPKAADLEWKNQKHSEERPVKNKVILFKYRPSVWR
jgi:hypothetical protein